MRGGQAHASKKSKVPSNSVRARLQARLQPLGVQATRTERNLGFDFTCTAGSLGVDGRLEDASERDPGPCSCQRSRPSSKEGTRSSRAPQAASGRSASTQSTRRVVSAKAPPAAERAPQRYNSGLTAL